VSVASRFWALVEKGPDCWLYRGHIMHKGYGLFWTGEKVVRAHRYSWQLSFGDPGALHVLHDCDNPPCVNPDHLFLGTEKDNADDKVSKGRQSKGESHGCARLTREKVSEIRQLRARGVKQLKVARMFGVGKATIADIEHGRTWA